MELTERKKKILRAIVDEYIRTAEPVGSKTIAQMPGMDFSSATIRPPSSPIRPSTSRAISSRSSDHCTRFPKASLFRGAFFAAPGWMGAVHR